jgi:hypothetical protein
VRRPDPASARSTLSLARERLRGARYLADDVLYVAGRYPRAIARRAQRFWGGLSRPARGWVAAALAALLVAAVAIVVALPRLPCSFPGGDTCPPSDDAEQLVPADALAYLHVNLDPDTDQYDQAAAIAGDLPLISAQVVDRALAQVPGPAGRPIDFERDLRPWFGGEAAVAVLGDRGAAELVDLLEVSDEQRAGEFADAIGGSSAMAEDYEGVEIAVDRRGIATAQVEGFLVMGTRNGVRAIVDAATGAGDATPLTDDERAIEVRDQLPDERIADVYLSADGVRRLISRSQGVIGLLAPLLAPSATRGAGAAVVATDGGLELAVRSALDPGRADSAPGFFGAFPRFQPTLTARLAPGTLGYIGIGEPRTAVAALAERASDAAGVAAGLSDIVRDLRAAGSGKAFGELLTALGDEAALALEPRAGRARAALPYLELIAGGVDERAARRALAAFSSRSSKTRKLAGVEAHSLRLSATIDVTYAVFDGIAAAAGDPDGIEALAAGHGGLDQSGLYERATADFDDRASLIGFVDIGGLVAVGERLGLGEDPVYATFAGEFRHLEALGLRVDYGDELLATDARLLVSEPGAPAG